jgi:cytochrome c oxidase cbb3-type subunit 3
MWAFFRGRHLTALALIAASTAMLVCETSAQNNPGTNAKSQQVNSKEPTAARLMLTPWVKNTPGGVSPGPTLINPMTDEPGSAERGMEYYMKMNCFWCHAPNGGGAIGPSLSNDNDFKFGPHPAQHYTVISNGAPLGMPAWGSVLPSYMIWDIVTYINSISKEPTHSWGTTVSAKVAQTETEQVPFEFAQSVHPWSHLEPFSSGNKPTDHPPSTQHNVEPSK